MTEIQTDNAVVVHANHCQFGPGAVARNPKVLSRMLLWCLSGRGSITVNGKDFDFLPQDYLWIPWGHDIAYRADASTPFLVGGVHIVPDHAPDQSVVHDVAHTQDHPLADDAGRRDTPLGPLDGLFHGNGFYSEGPGHLAEHIVMVMGREPLSRSQTHALAVLLLEELAELVTATPRRSGVGPPNFRAALHHVRQNLRHKMTLDDMARIAQVSRSTLGRMFRKYLGCSALEWLNRQRLREAERLLRTTSLPVGEVGRRVGIEDPYYFSKLFKRNTSLSPAAFRKQKGGL